MVAGVSAGLDLRPLSSTEVQNHLTDFGLEPSYGSHTRIGGLSGGQKAKLVFAGELANPKTRGLIASEQLPLYHGWPFRMDCSDGLMDGWIN